MLDLGYCLFSTCSICALFSFSYAWVGRTMMMWWGALLTYSRKTADIVHGGVRYRFDLADLGSWGVQKALGLLQLNVFCLSLLEARKGRNTTEPFRVWFGCVRHMHTAWKDSPVSANVKVWPALRKIGGGHSGTHPNQARVSHKNPEHQHRGETPDQHSTLTQRCC